MIRRLRSSIARLPVSWTRTRSIVRGFWQDTRGVSLAITALMMTSLLSMLALSIDLGHLYVARSEAQRAADAAALAGASAFLNHKPEDAAVVDDARRRSERYVAANPIRGLAGEITDFDVKFKFASERSVSVTVRREAVPMWFAQIFGISTRPVAASATAGAVPAISADCVSAAPALPSFDWNWNVDQGREVTIVPQALDDIPEPPDPLRYFMLDFPGNFEDNPDECRSGRVSIDDEMPVDTPPFNNNWAWKLFETDPNAFWDEDLGIVSDHGWNSPRIITIMLFDPVSASGSNIKAMDFVLFFVEQPPDTQDRVRGRFLAYASGTGHEGPTSQTALTLQLTR